MAQAQWQEMMGALFSNGVINGQLNSYVVTVTSGLGISVASGKAMIQGFLSRSDAAVALTCATADPTNPRIDRAVLHADLTAHALTVILLTGTPAPSPSPPALTQTATVWEVSLYQVRVNATQTTLTAGSLTDERIYAGLVQRAGDTMTGGLTAPNFQVTAGQNMAYSSNAAQDVTPQSGAANGHLHVGWSGSAQEIPFGDGTGAVSANLASTIIGGAGAVAKLAGQATVGSYGVPPLVASGVVTVASTSLTTILSTTLPAGDYYALLLLTIGNGTAANTPTMHTPGNLPGFCANDSRAKPTFNNMGLLDGSTCSFGANFGQVPTSPCNFNWAGGAMTWSYQTTGTPSDRVGVYIFRLA